MGDVLSNFKFGRISDGMVRLGLNGQIAVNVNGAYKYYNPKKGTLVNCDSFVFDVGSEFFFAMPTNKVKTGDIILINNKPNYVLSVPEKNKIEVLDYFDGQIKNILPERHTFLGNAYMYTKIVSLLGNKAFNKKSIMKFMMFNSLLGGKGSNAFGNIGSNPMLMMMMLNGNNPFGEIMDFDEDDEDGLFGGLDMFNADEDEEEKVETKKEDK